MHVDDDTRMQHIREAAQEAIELMGDAGRKDLDTDRKLSLAIVRLLETIGEAANGVSLEYRQAHSNLPWSGMISMRNRLIHGYFDVNLDVVWKTVEEDLIAGGGKASGSVDYPHPSRLLQWQ